MHCTKKQKFSLPRPWPNVHTSRVWMKTTLLDEWLNSRTCTGNVAARADLVELETFQVSAVYAILKSWDTFMTNVLSFSYKKLLTDSLMIFGRLNCVSCYYVCVLWRSCILNFFTCLCLGWPSQLLFIFHRVRIIPKSRGLKK